MTVAISLEGVHVIDNREKHVLLGLRFQELSWDHTSPEEEEPVLWLEFDGDSEGTPVNKLLRIYSKQAELMSGLIEYCIELSQAAEPTLSQESASGPHEAPSPSPPPTQRPKLRRQGSVVCSRIQHLSTIDYVEDGKPLVTVCIQHTGSHVCHRDSRWCPCTSGTSPVCPFFSTVTHLSTVASILQNVENRKETSFGMGCSETGSSV